MSRRRDDGSATLWTMSFAALLTAVGVTAILIVAGLTAHRQASAAADLAALAAAGRSLSDESMACEAAAESAAANGARLVACQLQEDSVVVSVERDTDSPWLPGFSVVARAGYG